MGQLPFISYIGETARQSSDMVMEYIVSQNAGSHSVDSAMLAAEMSIEQQQQQQQQHDDAVKHTVGRVLSTPYIAVV